MSFPQPDDRYRQPAGAWSLPASPPTAPPPPAAVPAAQVPTAPVPTAQAPVSPARLAPAPVAPTMVPAAPPPFAPGPYPPYRVPAGSGPPGSVPPGSVPPGWGGSPPGGAAFPPRLPAPGRPTSRRSATAAVVAGLAAALIVIGLFLGLTAGSVGILERSSGNASGSRSGGLSPAPTAPAPSSPDPGSGGGSGSGSGSAGGSSPTPGNWSEVAATVNPGVVDVETRLSGGIGAGTGMVLTDSGRVLTNAHVVDGATRISVTVVTTGDVYSATVVGADPSNDVAVLQLDGASGLATIPLGDSDAVRVGDQIAAIGNAGGRGGDPVVATGKVVGLHQTITAADQIGGRAERLTDMIQVDANVQPGDSGGPLADTDGKVVGMNTAAAVSRGRSRSGGNEGYAIPINRAVKLAEQLASGASPSTGSGGSGNPGSSGGGQRSGGGFLGVRVQSGTGGALVVGVQTGSPAEKAGLRAGATIIAVDDQAVASADDLTEVLSAHAPGDQVTVTWQTASGGQERQAKVTLGSR